MVNVTNLLFFSVVHVVLIYGCEWLLQGLRLHLLKLYSVISYHCTQNGMRGHRLCTSPFPTSGVHKSLCQVGWETKYCNVEPNVCGTLLWKMFHVTLLAHRILRLILDFWKICAILHILVVNLHLQETQYYDTGALLKVLILIKYFRAHFMTYSVYTLTTHYLCGMKLSWKVPKLPINLSFLNKWWIDGQCWVQWWYSIKYCCTAGTQHKMNSKYSETIWKVGSSQICIMLVTVRVLFRLLYTEFAEAFIQLTLKLITTLTVVICGKDKQIRSASGRQSTE